MFQINLVEIFSIFFNLNGCGDDGDGGGSTTAGDVETVATAIENDPLPLLPDLLVVRAHQRAVSMFLKI